MNTKIEEIKKIAWKENDVFLVKVDKNLSMAEIENLTEKLAKIRKDHFSDMVTFIVMNNDINFEIYRKADK